MSYFMVTKGRKPDFNGIDKVEAVPIRQTQLSRRAEDLAEDGDTSNLYLVSDGETGTSDNFVTEAEEQFYNVTGSFAGTRFDKVIDACGNAGNSFRLWYDPLDVTKFDDMDLLKKDIADQMRNLYKFSHKTGKTEYRPLRVWYVPV